MLSPKRANFAPCQSCQAVAARIHAPSAATTSLSCQWPTMILRSRRRRAPMKPNSRSPCAAWFRFMKSMSISPQGRSRLNCVCRCASGLRKFFSPLIHIFAGENVCIHATRPTQLGATFASSMICVISCGRVSTGLRTTFSGSSSALLSDRAMTCAFCATFFSAASPYKCWLPTRNQTSRFLGRRIMDKFTSPRCL